MVKFAKIAELGCEASAFFGKIVPALIFLFQYEAQWGLVTRWQLWSVCLAVVSVEPLLATALQFPTVPVQDCGLFLPQMK